MDTAPVVCLVTVPVSCVDTAPVVCLVTVPVSCVDIAPVVCLVTVPISCLDTAAVPGGVDPPRTPPLEHAPWCWVPDIFTYFKKNTKPRFELSRDSSIRARQYSQPARGKSARYAREFGFARCHDEAGAKIQHGSAAGNTSRTGTVHFSRSTKYRAKASAKF